MPRPTPEPHRVWIRLIAGVAVAFAAGTGHLATAGDPHPAAHGLAMRVETEITSGGRTEPVARSLTLFRDGVAWDFLERPAPDGDGSRFDLVAIALHDPARERIVVVDAVRDLKTEVTAVRLERLGVSLAKWARESDDRLVRWAGGPDFESGLVDEDGRLELAGPRVRYAVTHAVAPSPEAAAAYRRFADGAILLKTLLHPGGVPPFPRLALNRQLQSAGAIPERVTLEVEPRLGPLVGRPERLTSAHRVHPRLLATDVARIEEAEARVAAAKAVDLATFADRQAAARQDP
jgi:hypothetical protein